MKLLFQADEDLNLNIVKGLRQHDSAIDIRTAREGGTIGKGDPEVLRLAAVAGRILISHDPSTMVRHFYDFVGQRSSSGLLIIPQDVRIGVAIEELFMIWATSDADEWVNRVDFLPL
jgi:hypothetical protein